MGVMTHTKRKIHDFKTVKHKLGKKRRQLSHTNLNFKTKVILIPLRSGPIEKEDCVNNRNLTLNDILSQLKHHNSSIRKGAVLGLIDLLQRHPSIMNLQLSVISEGIVGLILDSNREVRYNFQVLLDYLLPNLPEDLIAPFFPLFSAYIRSALTSINHTTVFDGLEILQIWLNHHPSLVSKYHYKFMEIYLGLFSKSEETSTITDYKNLYNENMNLKQKSKKENDTNTFNSLTFKTTVLKSLLSILKNLFSRVTDKTRNSNQNGLSSSQNVNNNCLSHLEEYNNDSDDDCDIISDKWPNAISINIPYNNGYHVNDLLMDGETELLTHGTTKIEETNFQSTDSFLELNLCQGNDFKFFFEKLFPLLISIWIECDIRNLTVQNIPIFILLAKILKYLLSHFNSIIEEKAERIKWQYLETYKCLFFKHIFCFYPIKSTSLIQKSSSITSNTNDSNKLIELNVLITQVGSQFVHTNIANECWEIKLVDFIENILQKSSQIVLLKKILSVLEILFPYIHEERLRSLLECFDRFQKLCPPSSVAKKRCVKIFSHLILKHSPDSILDYKRSIKNDDDDKLMEKDEDKFKKDHLNNDNNNKKDEKDSKNNNNNKNADKNMDTDSNRNETCIISQREIEQEKSWQDQYYIPFSTISSWLRDLPISLYELKSSDPEFSKYILDILTHYGSQILSDEKKKHFNNLQRGLVPFFWRESVKKKGESGIFGPFLDLPEYVQKSAINVLYYLPKIDEDMTKGIIQCLASPKISFRIAKYLIETIECPRHLAISQYFSICISVLIQISSQKGCNVAIRLFEIGRLIAYTINLLRLGQQMFNILDQWIEQMLEDNSGNPLCILGLTNFIGFYLKLNHPNLVLPSNLSQKYHERLWDAYFTCWKEDGILKLAFCKDLLMNSCIFPQFIQYWIESAGKDSNFDKDLLSSFVLEYPSEIRPLLLKNSELFLLLVKKIKDNNTNNGSPISVQIEAEINLIFNQN